MRLLKIDIQSICDYTTGDKSVFYKNKYGETYRITTQGQKHPLRLESCDICKENITPGADMAWKSGDHKYLCKDCFTVVEISDIL